MRKSTGLFLTLGVVGVGAGVYLYLKNKNTAPIETFSQDFYDDVNDGQLSFTEEQLKTQE